MVSCARFTIAQRGDPKDAFAAASLFAARMRGLARISASEDKDPPPNGTVLLHPLLAADEAN